MHQAFRHPLRLSRIVRTLICPHSGQEARCLSCLSCSQRDLRITDSSTPTAGTIQNRPHDNPVLVDHKFYNYRKVCYPAREAPSYVLARRWFSSKSKKSKKRPQERKSGRTGSGSSGQSSGTMQQVMTMIAVRKELPGGKELFGESSLSFNYGAKIGVLGVNGSGKSTVLRILAGVGG